jgi:hypothetical protein
MRYLLLTNVTGTDHAALRRELTASGELLGDEVLADAARVVQAGADGLPYVLPLPSGRERLAACWVVDCESEGRAIAIAAHIAASQGAPVELRAVMTAPGEEM